jgi:3-dehydroquinate dehydratase-1
MSNYCLPIQRTSTVDVLAAIGEQSTYDFFEVWIDDVQDFDLLFLDKLVTLLGGKLVLVFRRPQLAPIRMPLAQRLRVLEHLHNTPALVDLDITSQAAELKHIVERKLSLQTIVSHHDYRHTPGDSQLQTLVRAMQAHQPGILKIATLCQTEQDALRLLQLLLKLRAGQQRFIVLGMGEAGVITRIFGTLWGNELTFAPPNLAAASAPGQLTQANTDTVLTILKG